MALRTSEIQDIVATDSINRVAFPAFQVFIYGRDVSSDVAAIRINQSGGSTERSPMTCSITLQNQQDKYIITHTDMFFIGVAKSKLDNRWESLSSMYNNSNREPRSSDYHRVEGSNNTVYPIGGQFVTIDNALLGELAPKLAQASDEDRVYILRAYLGSQGSYEITEADAAAITSELQNALQMLKDNKPQDDVFDSYREESLGYNIKQQVVHDKMSYTATLKPQNKDESILNYEDRLIFDYPMQEGDCIFHANDPVRIAVRDPFDPRIWYWGFTGFIDTWTEDVGINFDSEITITCTDVSKVARYAVVQLKTFLLDPNLDAYLGSLKDQGGQTAANTGLVLTKELFEGLSVLEILEVIFFGSQSGVSLVDGSVFSQLNALEDLSEEELRNFFISKFGLTFDQALEYVPYGLKSNKVDLDAWYVDYGSSWTKIKNKVVDALTSKSIERFNALNWPGITSPRNVSFKRKSDTNGVHFYVLGTPSDADTYFGATEIKDLYVWNEEIHHRVRKDDVSVMHKDKYTRGRNSLLSIDQIIYQIGTDLENYPVGAGRVFFMSPAKMDSVIGDGVLDHAVDGAGSMHSVFKDRLSYLYDLADVIDFRFYATPRGDLVFEMPFYDFDPMDFWKSKDVATVGVDVSKIEKDYEDIFQKVYEGSYDTEEWDNLTNMAFERNTANLDLIEYEYFPKFDYGRHFTIDVHEQMGFSNTMTDRGMLTAYRVKTNYVENYEELLIEDAQKYKIAMTKSLIPTLGVRMGEGNMWGFVKGENAAEMYAALQLNKINSESRNVGIQTVPKFGLMVNRPIHWIYRNYYANIVSISHSIVWNGDINTSINVNQIRGWAGEAEEGGRKPLYRHFGDSNRPFNMVEFISRAKEKDKQNKKSGV